MKLNLNNVSLKITAGLPKQFPADRLPQIAFSGRSNVGKSSLINEILYKRLARDLNRARTVPAKHKDIEGIRDNFGIGIRIVFQGIELGFLVLKFLYVVLIQRTLFHNHLLHRLL